MITDRSCLKGTRCGWTVDTKIKGCEQVHALYCSQYGEFRIRQIRHNRVPSISRAMIRYKRAKYLSVLSVDAKSGHLEKIVGMGARGVQLVAASRSFL